MHATLARRRTVGGPGAGGNDRMITGGTRSDPAAISVSFRHADTHAWAESVLMLTKMLHLQL